MIYHIHAHIHVHSVDFMQCKCISCTQQNRIKPKYARFFVHLLAVVSWNDEANCNENAQIVR